VNEQIITKGVKKKRGGGLEKEKEREKTGEINGGRENERKR
jgi:hypothetical protein